MAKQCPKCSATVASGALFCSQCGQSVGSQTCGGCGYSIPGGASFCPGCGKPTGESAVPQTREGRWTRHADHFATKIEAAEVKQLFSKGIRVEQGTSALLFVDGRYVEKLPPGFHDLSSGFLADRSLKKILQGRGRGTVVLVSNADQLLEFRVTGLRDREQLPMDAVGTLATRVADPGVFFVNLMAGRENLRLDDLGDWLQDELHDALMEAVSGYALDDLTPGSQAFKEKVEVGIAGHLKRSLDRNGLEFVQLRSMRLVNADLDELRQHRAEVKLGARKVDTYKERADVIQRMRDAVDSSKMGQIRSEEQMASFLQEIDKGKVLRKEEMDEFVRTFAEKKEDHQLARFHLLKKLEMEHGFELSRIRLVEQGHLDQAGLDNELVLERKRLEATREQAARDFEQGISQQGTKFDQALRQKTATVDAQLEAQRKASALKREEAKDGVELLDKLKQGKHQRQKEMVEAEAQAKVEALKAKVSFTAEQLAYIQAAESPELAEALKEKFRAERAQEHHTEMVDEMRRAQERHDDLAREALRTQRDAAGAVAAGRRAGSGASSGPQTGDVIVCRKCTSSIELKPLLKFCPKCGESIS